MPKTRTILALILIPLLAFIIACSSGDDSSSSSGDSGGDQQSSSQSSDSSNDGDSDVSDLLESCSQFLAFAGAAALGSTQGSSLGDDIELSSDYFRRLADSAPGEIKADMQIVAAALITFFDVLEELEIDFEDPESFAKLDAEALAKMEAASAAIDTDAVNQAGENVEAYFERECS